MSQPGTSLPETSALSRARIVLVEPRYGGNIGQCARAMFNMGFSRLVLVSPSEHLTPEARWMAREGTTIIERAEVRGSLEEALGTVTLAIGTTRRVGKYRRPVMTPREAAARMLPLLAGGNEAAFVFGREMSGLTGEELDRCQWLVSIPASEHFPSLNLAQAVLICCYELFLAASGHDGHEGLPQEAPSLAGPEQLERFYGHLGEVLREIRFLVGDQAPAIFRTLRRIFGRADLEPRDLKILHGILAQMEWYRGQSLRLDAMSIRWAHEEEFPEVLALVERCGLPGAGLDPAAEHLRLLLARQGGALAGCVGLELYPDAAFLRSLAVAEEHRGSGLGGRLVAEAVGEARRTGLSAVVLLTTTAADYFARHGFEVVARSEVPPSIHASAEWSKSCCSTATTMRLLLSPSSRGPGDGGARGASR